VRGSVIRPSRPEDFDRCARLPIYVIQVIYKKRNRADGACPADRSTGEGTEIELTDRQREILDIVKQHAPITGEQIAECLGLSRPTIRSDLSILVMLGLIDAKPKVGYFLGKAVSPEGRLNRRLKELAVKDAMSRPVAIREQATVDDAVFTLFLEQTGMLAVTDDDGRLTGVVTVKDLLKVAFGNPNAASIPVQMVMTRLPRVATVSPEDSLLEAARRMIEHQVSGMPVVRRSEGDDAHRPPELVGRISKTNVVRILLDVASEL